MRIFFFSFSFPPQMGNKVKVRQDFLYSYSYNSGRRRASVGRSGFERERERERERFGSEAGFIICSAAETCTVCRKRMFVLWLREL